MELVRKILFAIEDHEHGSAPRLAIEGYSEEQIGYHVYLMIEAGLLDGVNTTHLRSESPEATATRLTWEGHEFVEAARDDTRWNKAMTVVKEQGGSITIGVLKRLLISLMTKGFGLG